MRRFAAVAAVATILLGAQPAAAAADDGSVDPSRTTRVEAVTADVAGGLVSVQGRARFVDSPRQVASDPAGDAEAEGAGMDLAAAVVSRPDPTRSELVFTVEVADDDPTLFGSPEAVIYAWYFRSVDNRGLRGGDFLLKAVRTSQPHQPGSADAYFGLWRFWVNGSCCEEVMDVAGTMRDGVITWTVPLDSLEYPNSGRRIVSIEPHPERPVQVQPGISPYWWTNLVQFDTMTVTEDYAVPEPTVVVGIAPAGTPVDEVPLSTDAAVTLDSGEFAGEVPLPAEPGEYMVVARACYGGGNCGLAATGVTIPAS